MYCFLNDSHLFFLFVLNSVRNYLYTNIIQHPSLVFNNHTNSSNKHPHHHYHASTNNPPILSLGSGTFHYNTALHPIQRQTLLASVCHIASIADLPRLGLSRENFAPQVSCPILNVLCMHIKKNIFYSPKKEALKNKDQTEYATSSLFGPYFLATYM